MAGHGHDQMTYSIHHVIGPHLGATHYSMQLVAEAVHQNTQIDGAKHTGHTGVDEIRGQVSRDFTPAAN